MKNSNQSFIRAICYNLFILGFLFLFAACNNGPSKDKTETDAIEKVDDIFWNVKAILPNGQSIDIKGFDNAGKPFDIKAIQNSNQDNLLDVKAILDGEKLPVKILVSKNQFASVVAITNKGNAYKIKAITPEGETMEVIGVARFDNIVIMKVISKKGKFYGVKAISPAGQLNDIKGIKINSQEREMSLKGQSIHAHVKAMHPSANEDNFKLPKKNITKGLYKK